MVVVVVVVVDEEGGDFDDDDDVVVVALQPSNAPPRALELGCTARRGLQRRGGPSLDSYDGVQRLRMGRFPDQ